MQDRNMARRSNPTAREMLEAYWKINPKYEALPPEELEPITSWVGKRMRYHAYIKRGGMLHCCKCGHEFRSDAKAGRTVICPECGTRVKVVESKRRYITDSCFTQKLMKAGRFQLIRTFETTVSEGRSGTATIWTDHVYDTLIGENPGEYAVWSRRLAMFPNSRIVPFSYNPEFIKPRMFSDGWQYNYHEGWRLKGIIPYPAIQDWLKKRQPLRMRTCDMTNVITLLKSSPHFETLWKRGEEALCRRMLAGREQDIDRWWPELKIALRHGKRFGSPEDISDWTDTIEMADSLGLDTRSPKYCCPQYQKAMHDMLMKRLDRRREEEERMDELKRLMKKTNNFDPNNRIDTRYRKKMGGLLAFCTTKDGITIRTLQDVKDFFDEGEALHHCVYSNGYYLEPNTLILDASVEGKRTETIEIDTKSWEMIQCRGNCNQDSRYHAKIVEAVEALIPSMRKLSNAKA